MDRVQSHIPRARTPASADRGTSVVCWCVVLCMSMQGFAFAVTRTSGSAHFHLGSAAASLNAAFIGNADLQGDSEPDHHEHEHQHESSVAHHHHDASDPSVVYVDGETEDATDRAGVTPKRIVFDLDSLPTVTLPMSALPSIPVACRFSSSAFKSGGVEPLDRPPR